MFSSLFCLKRLISGCFVWAYPKGLSLTIKCFGLSWKRQYISGVRVLFLTGGRRHWFFCSSKWSFGLGIWCCHNISSWYGFPNTGWWPFFYLTDFFYMTLMSFFFLLRLRRQFNLVKDSPLLDSCWGKKCFLPFKRTGGLSCQCMWGSHFWLFLCYYSYLQANTYEELPEQVIGAARLAHVEPSTAVVPNLENTSESNKDNSSNDATSSEDDSSKKTNWFSLFCEEFDEIFCFYPFKLCY